MRDFLRRFYRKLISMYGDEQRREREILNALIEHVDNELKQCTQIQIDVIAQIGVAILKCEGDLPQGFWCTQCLERKVRILELIKRWETARAELRLRREIQENT